MRDARRAIRVNGTPYEYVVGRTNIVIWGPGKEKKILRTKDYLEMRDVSYDTAEPCVTPHTIRKIILGTATAPTLRVRLYDRLRRSGRK